MKTKKRSTELSQSTRTPHFVDESTQEPNSVNEEVSTSSILNSTPNLTTSQVKGMGLSSTGTQGGPNSSEFDFILQFAHKFVSMMSQAKKEREENFARFDELNNKMDILLSKMESPR